MSLSLSLSIYIYIYVFRARRVDGRAPVVAAEEREGAPVPVSARDRLHRAHDPAVAVGAADPARAPVQPRARLRRGRYDISYSCMCMFTYDSHLSLAMSIHCNLYTTHYNHDYSIIAYEL